MKKLFPLLFSVVLLFAVSGCGNYSNWSPLEARYITITSVNPETNSAEGIVGERVKAGGIDALASYSSPVKGNAVTVKYKTDQSSSVGPTITGNGENIRVWFTDLTNLFPGLTGVITYDNTCGGEYDINGNYVYYGVQFTASATSYFVLGGTVDVQHHVTVNEDGTVLAEGNNYYHECELGSWTDITAVSTGSIHTLGLKRDGTVVAAGGDFHGQCGVEEWTDIIAIAAGGQHSVGLRADGTVVAVGLNNHGQCDVSDWTDIVEISAGRTSTTGIKADGTVLTAGK